MEESVKGSQGSPDISSPPDPTQTMPLFNEGRTVESMSPEEARGEWEAIILDKDGKYRNWPNSVRIGRQNKLWDHGFSEKIKQDQKAQEEKSREWLEGEKERIEKRDTDEALSKARKEASRYFGGEQKAESVLQAAHEVLKQVATEEDLDYLSETGLGNSPRICEIIANLSRNQELYPVVRKIGLKNLIHLGQAMLGRWR